METKDIMDVRAENAFSEMLHRGYLAIIEPGSENGSRLYRSVSNADTRSLSRDELIVLHQARWPDSSANIVSRATGRYRLSNQVRWSDERYLHDIIEKPAIVGVEL